MGYGCLQRTMSTSGSSCWIIGWKIQHVLAGSARIETVNFRESVREWSWPAPQAFDRDDDITRQRMGSNSMENERTERNRTFRALYSMRAGDYCGTNKGESHQYHTIHSLHEERFSSENSRRSLRSLQDANSKRDSRTNRGEQRKGKRKSSWQTNIIDREDTLRGNDDHAPPNRKRSILLKLHSKSNPPGVAYSTALS